MILDFVQTDKKIRSWGIVLGVLITVMGIEKAWIANQNKQLTVLREKKETIARYISNTSQGNRLNKDLTAQGLGAYHLTGIGRDQDKIYAIINDDIYSVNDKLGEYVIREIGTNGVTLQNMQTQEFGRLTLYTPEEAAIYLSQNKNK
jgi:hypothetical protein